MKFFRSFKKPHQTFKRPLTCANEVGWWTKDEPIRENLKWSYICRQNDAFRQQNKYKNKGIAIN
ncbi:hypothetical protein BpHYR1_009566 [Brachionus plicatilis]|uniref:Uncharacterized protein n=1 Tax=Brachionus plicatilis TaxID=10195 RepID=A0A3M7SPZ5_BRAPC|nr:hypothetical protein BpHYR1_009566 [Brachionus plicatilis]